LNNRNDYFFVFLSIWLGVLIVLLFHCLTVTFWVCPGEFALKIKIFSKKWGQFELYLTYKDSTISIMWIMCSCEKICYNLTIWCCMIIQDRSVCSYTELSVRSDVRLHRRRFSVWSYMIMYYIRLRSDTFVQEFVVDRSIRFLDLGGVNFIKKKSVYIKRNKL
jgi:hypothetical protein